MVNHVHLRDIRGEDLDLGPSAAQVDQDPVGQVVRGEHSKQRVWKEVVPSRACMCG